jgi:hypothetical protein
MPDTEKHWDSRFKQSESKPSTLQISSVVCSLWLAWFIVTFGDLMTGVESGESDSWTYIPNAIFNLFTPILIGNAGGTLVITLPLLVGGLFAGDLLGRRIPVKILRIVYNLLVLFALTIAVDVITWSKPMSLLRISEVYRCVTTKPKPEWCPVMTDKSYLRN